MNPAHTMTSSSTTAERSRVGTLVRYNRVPGATYRLQLNAAFDLNQAKDLIPYLEELGVTDVYASPLLMAAPGSTHGYDTCSHAEISAELGGMRAFEDFVSALRVHDMGLLLDIVPNHMGANPANRWWWDLLKHGRASPFAAFFDIAWDSQRPRVILPVLGDIPDRVIAAGDLRIEAETGESSIRYFDARFPISLETAPELIEQCREPGSCPSELMREILDAQHYELAFWRDGLERINYRRFFDVSSLVALRMEDEAVFQATHRTLLEWIERGWISGLRVDHPDGLRDPKGYFDRLQAAFANATGRRERLYTLAEKILSPDEHLPAEWPIAGTTGYDFLNAVNGLFVDESNGERMVNVYRDFTGCEKSFEEVAYESKKHVITASFSAELSALASAAQTLAHAGIPAHGLNMNALRAALLELVACFPVYRTYVREDSTVLSPSDREVISHAVDGASARCPRLRDAIQFIASVLRLEAVPPAQQGPAREFVLRFQQMTGPVAAKGIEDTAFYRYFPLLSLNEVGGHPGRFGVSLEEFHEANRERCAAWPHSMLASSTHDTKRGEDARARINVLSEMPEEWERALQTWCRRNEVYRTAHDGEALPDSNDEYLFYQTLVGSWPGREELYSDGRIRREALGRFCERVGRYMLKAVREAKRHTSWTEPGDNYEKALQRFVEGALHPTNAAFIDDFTRFHDQVAFFGAINSLSQTLLKLTCPGVPDIYQGSEMWNLSLVDPDNRRPVDYRGIRQCLSRIKAGQSWTRTDVDAANELSLEEAKLFVCWKSLQLRRAHRDLFAEGSYVPMDAYGSEAKHVCAFRRSLGREHVIVVCPRLCLRLLHGTRVAPCGRDVWRGTTLSMQRIGSGSWRNEFTGEQIDAPSGRMNVADALARFPVALLSAS